MPSSPDSAERAPLRHRRLLVLGANGPTGRRTVDQALERGHEVHALTRHPESFSLERHPDGHPRLRVVAGDATDEAVVDAAVAEADAVVCTIGTAFTRKPVEVYSVTARLLVAAMRRHGRRRLVVVTSGGVDTGHPAPRAVARLSRSLMRDHLGRTVYDDMQRMEDLVTASDLDWTVVRPPGLVDRDGTGYAVAETRIDGPLMARGDLAAMLLDQLEDDRFVRRTAAAATPGLRVGVLHMLRHEVLKH
ncbi:NAD(P)-dependent oxidoreductase [uncultured Pseudokineococcus sp.]|uniref:NAD(P)-dependent oxidoreductase n=1 Tax=uncultured Pseudokineococcus sp. TaxID=1642928 RepID=UPI002635FCD5|nr:NAD(P)H-binding protein [uncultured Pseudokineococcus sp.]